MDQKRFFLALVISTAILLGWSYFFSPRETKPASNSPHPDATEKSNSEQPQATASQQVNLLDSGNSETNLSEDSTPQQVIRISTPLYKVVIDSRGAVAKSWVLLQNKDTGRPLHSIAGSKENPLPLELVSPEGLARNQFPLRLEINGASGNEPSTMLPEKWSDVLNSRNYRIIARNFTIEGSLEGEKTVDIKPGESKKQIDFEMIEPATGVKVIKSFSFDPESYIVDIGVSVSRNDQPVPNVKLVIGPSIGDQGVSHYTFYSVAPQALIATNEDAIRVTPEEVHNQKSTDNSAVGYRVQNGPVKWASIGDTYFAMALVLPKTVDKVELKTEEFQHETKEGKEKRFLISELVPVPSDGSTMHLYVGPKDHFALEHASEILTAKVNSEIDLEQLIDYGWLGFTRPIAVQLLKAIQFLNNVTGNYGVAIILFTIAIYTLFFPLKWRSTKSMKKAQKHAPRMKELQEKIKGLKANDPRLKELQMEQLRLMKEANPLGGCLPLLIQMPFLIALYSAITISIDFRQATFLWLPDLSAADPIHLLPILMAASMLILQLVTPNPSADPLQRKMMAIVLPAMMLYMLWSAPSGLLLYWLVGNIVGFGQQLLINRMVKSEDEGGPPEEKKAVTKSNPKLGTTRVSRA